ncbi:MAG: HlyD family efflux transporter periplasmic adaptor subunit [Alphaproteobacteria bacterium]|nr:HlyD family efflux transporter periplasmic adaptor subunit [Alphaproteobacteria bacterium]
MSDLLTRDPAARAARRRACLLALVVFVLLCGLSYGAWWLLVGRFHETTDDAYVAGNIVAVTARENATVMALHADNTQQVRRGQLLVEMDPATARVKLEAAEARLARAVRAVRGNFAGADTYRAQLAQAEVTLDQAKSDYDRRKAAMKGAVSGEELAHAREAMDTAQAAVNAAQSGLDQAQTSIAGADVAHNPEVLAAIADLKSAALVLAHMKVVAPVGGVIAQRTVQVGQHVSAGTPLMAVVPLDAVWIDANFKEVQLSDMRVGQKAAVTTDIYGSSVIYHGHVSGLGAGTGSAFAILPPQNASGNWIKIVQRVPVRIALDPAEVKAHPLRVGLSVSVDVAVRDTSGPLVAGMAAKSMRADTGDEAAATIDAQVKKIISENSARAP